MGTASNPISHHTSHTLENGASSSNQGARGDHVASNSDGIDEGNALDAPLARCSTNLLNLTANTIPYEPDETNNGTLTNTSSSCTSLQTVSSEVGDCDRSIDTGATSIRSTGNISDFSIIDSTLREGEQFATAFFTSEQKIQIAQALDDFGVEYIELTSPAASKQSRADCEAICKLGLRAKILCHIRCHMDDARIAVQSGVDGINMCIGTSAQLMEHSHGKDMAHITAKATEIVQYVKAHNLEIRFSGEDSFRSDFNEILKLYSIVDRLGADRVGIADTVGGASPREVFTKINALRKVVDCDIETHFHNDTGCAVANAYAALDAGATHIDCTILGIGERNGITSTAGLLACLVATGSRYVLDKYNIEKLRPLEHLVAEIVGVKIPFNAPVLSTSM